MTNCTAALPEVVASTAVNSAAQGDFAFSSLEGTLVTLGTAGAAWLIRKVLGWLKARFVHA